ncbi:DUF6297 family protein [Actinocorallia sp. A-T 12471]|uniref:DUF6297 family protein n=1 Tax=Actinocorallia sp. A-T 12471 TaxID=3089813 RepID=UPI0029D345DD|nr:DUF6297 family protein [Actinocorallia sp. A-T 12471]MDX6738329.1 DUF6297 family protein [Actinocorallia sp. A-T 12471]
MTALADDTRAVLALLRTSRRRGRKDVLYKLYLGVLAAAVASPLVWTTVQDALQGGASPGRAVVLVPFAVALTALAALWASIREGLTRGAVSLDAAVIDWVLPSPVRWENVLGTAFTKGVALRAAAGAVICVALLFVLWRTVLPLPITPASTIASSALAGALLGALSAALRALGAHRLRRSWYAGLLVLLGGAAALAWRGVPGASAVLWTGPWGWAAQAFVGGPYVWAALTALAVVTAVTLALASRRLTSLTFAELRRGAETTGGLKTGLWLVDPAWASGTTQAAKADFSPSSTLPMPSHRALTPAWRDAVSLLRDADRPLRSAVLTVLALLAAQLPGRTALAASCALLYLAVSALVEGARACAADPGRTRYLPLPPTALALAFGMTPLAVMAAITTVAALALAPLGAAPAALAAVAVLLPAATATALAGAYRGFLPASATTGFDTPFGNTALFQIVSWHAGGPIALTVIALLAATPGPSGALCLLAGTASVTLWAARRGARAFAA